MLKRFVVLVVANYQLERIFIKLYQDCGGIPDANSEEEWTKNLNNSHYQNCYKQKGFSNKDYYWTSEKNDSASSWYVDFVLGREFWLSKSVKFYALCVR